MGRVQKKRADPLFSGYPLFFGECLLTQQEVQKGGRSCLVKKYGVDTRDSSVKYGNTGTLTCEALALPLHARAATPATVQAALRFY
jgi:hypothetical protein